MKRLINYIRDCLYNITDYGLIIIVIVVMISILGWRFDVLFNKSIVKEVIADLPVVQAGESKPNPLNDQQTKTVENTTEPKTQNTNTTKVISVVIPEGSYPSKIADILLNLKLINDKNEFIKRSMELGLDKKLRSGNFKINSSSSLDEIIKTIANAK